MLNEHFRSLDICVFSIFWEGREVELRTGPCFHSCIHYFSCPASISARKKFVVGRHSQKSNRTSQEDGWKVPHRNHGALCFLAHSVSLFRKPSLKVIKKIEETEKSHSSTPRFIFYFLFSIFYFLFLILFSKFVCFIFDIFLHIFSSYIIYHISYIISHIPHISYIIYHISNNT